MPFKTIEQHREWVREHRAKNPGQYRRWNKASTLRWYKRKQQDPIIKKQKTEKKKAKQFAKDMRLLHQAIVHIRSETMKREGLHHCRSCGAVVDDSQWSDKRGHIACANIKARVMHKERGTYRKQYVELKADKMRLFIKNLRRRHSIALKPYTNGGRRTGRTLDYLGCTAKQFAEHMQSLFIDGMSLDNYGAWHIDHIIPVSSFDLTDEDQIRKAFHYTNTQPLWAVDNMKKGASLPGKT